MEKSVRTVKHDTILIEPTFRGQICSIQPNSVSVFSRNDPNSFLTDSIISKHKNKKNQIYSLFIEPTI